MKIGAADHQQRTSAVTMGGSVGSGSTSQWHLSKMTRVPDKIAKIAKTAARIDRG
jgi:hypothetical protein